jgi:hypothetical protein
MTVRLQVAGYVSTVLQPSSTQKLGIGLRRHHRLRPDQRDGSPLPPDFPARHMGGSSRPAWSSRWACRDDRLVARDRARASQRRTSPRLNH